MPKSILFCYAHPDDEIGIVPLANRYMKEEDVYTTLICTTNGDVGTVSPEHLQGYASIPELRLAELERATKAAGFHKVVTFGYRDSGMMGNEDNNHPECSWQAPLEVLTRRVVEVMREVRPQVVITFNTFGAYGHPDHIKINQATQAAFEQLQGETDAPQKLYYVTGPTLLFRVGIALMRLRGKNPRQAGRNNDMDLIAAVNATTAITTKINVSRYLDAAWNAMDSYASQIQISPSVRRYRRLFGRLFQRRTGLSRVYPIWQPGEKIERDLFENVHLTPGVPASGVSERTN